MSEIHTRAATEEYRDGWNRIFGATKDVEEMRAKAEPMPDSRGVRIVDLMVVTGLAPSLSAAKRLIEQRAVSAGKPVLDVDATVPHWSQRAGGVFVDLGGYMVALRVHSQGQLGGER